MIKKFDDLTVVEFGHGTVTVELGKYGSQYAVFINNADTPGTPGQLVLDTNPSRGYEPDEIVLVFPTKQRAAEVVNSLFNGELVKVGQQPTPALSKFLEKEEWNDAFAQGFNAGFNSDEKPDTDVTHLVEALEACMNELRQMIERHNKQDQGDGSWLYDYQTVAEADAALAAHRKQGDE